jgi:WD40 repeat protein/transcriptional regulator with XRE-family HTH domain
MLTPPLSPESFQTFGDLLKFLRRRERLTQLELSIAVGYSEAQIGRLEQNQRKPDLITVKALLIPALHLEDEPDLARRLLELAQSTRQEDAPAPGVAPYKGLLFFDQADAALFFGRESLIAHLVERVTALKLNAASRFLAVVGASGSGKSSLVRAGLTVALQRAGWEIHIFTPTTNPLKMLAANDPSPGARNGQHHLVLVDQFEEAFTLCHDESERAAFIDRLISSAQDQVARISVVIGLRADFYSHCAQYPLLREAIAAQQEYIGQMTKDDLRRAIEEPARRGGWEFERGLVDILLNDVGADGTGQPEPGALPLLSHVLLATWERRRGRTLTLEGYRASGGVRGAIAETAESVFTDQLNWAQQNLAHDIFLRLTELGEGTEDTRRRASLNELARQSQDATQLRAVLNILADARLITLNEDSAEVAHEALIREWQRLHEWLTTDREGLRLHRHLTESALDWEARGHDASELYRGARLAQTSEWASTNEARLNQEERDFLAASIAQEQHEAMEREAQRQRELETAQRLAETERAHAEEQTRAATRLRARNHALAAAGALVTAAAIAAVILGSQAQAANVVADQQRAAALNAQATAVADFTRSEAQRLAAEANKLMLSNGDANLIALLAIRSLTMQYTPSGDAVLTGLTTREAPPREFTGHQDGIFSVAFSPDGKDLATGSRDKTARLWDIASGQTIRVFSGHTADVNSVDFSPDGKYLLTSSDDKTARLWNITSGQTVQIFPGHTSIVYQAVFSPDGEYIATASGDLTARIWDITTGKTVHILTGHSDYVTSVAFSPDGKYLLTGSYDRTARRWDTATGDAVHVFVGHSDTVYVADYSPNGKYVATGSDDHTARLWDVTTGQMVREFSGHQGFIQGIKFSPDGRYLLTGSADKTARLWDIATGKTVRVFSGNVLAVNGVTFSADGTLVAITNEDRIARVWSLQTHPIGIQFIRHNAAVWQASFSPDEKQVVTASEDGTARIWDKVTGQTVVTLTGHTDVVRGAIFSPDGKMVLTASADGTARLWDAASGKELRRFEGHTALVNRAVFSPDGKYVITTSYDGTARVWDAQTAQAIVIYRNQGPGHVNRIAFSPDGKTVITSGDDDTARIWDPLTGKDLMVFRGHADIVAGVAFSPEGKYLVTSSFDGSVLLWNVANGTEVRRFAGHPGGAFGAAFSRDGKYVLTSGADGTARLWNAQTGQEVRRFTGHTSYVRDVTFSSDGKYILTASDDNTARLWLTDLQDTIHAVCAVLTRDLTPEERMQFDISDQGPTCPNL